MNKKKQIKAAFLLILIFSISNSALSDDTPTKEQTADSSFFDQFLSFIGVNSKTPITSEGNINNSDKSNSFYDSALEYLENEEIDAAIIQLRNAIKHDPNNLSAYLLLGQTYLNKQSGNLAENTYKQAIANGVNEKLVAKHLASAYLQQLKYQNLLDNISISGLPKNEKNEIHVLRSQAYLRLGKVEEATKELDLIFANDPLNTSANIQLVRIKIAEDNTPSASKVLDDISERAIYDPEYWLLKGEVARQSNKISQAIKFYSEAIKLQNKHLLARQARASIYLDKNDLEASAKDIENIEQNYPEDLRGLMLKSLLKAKFNKTDEQQETLQTAYKLIEKINFLKLQEDHYNLMLISNLYFLGERYEEASSLLKRYLELKPEDLKAYHFLARIQLKQNQPILAKNTALKALKISNTIELQLLLAEAEMQQGNFNEASDIYTNLAKSHPELKNISLRLALAKLANGETENAINTLEKFAEGNSSTTSNRLTLARIYLGLGDYENSLRICEELINEYPSLPMPYNIAGNAHLGLNQQQQAATLFSKALEIAPDFIPAIFNLAILDIEKDQLSKAKKRINHILKIDKENSMAMIQMANIEQKLEKQDQEILWLQKAFETDPQVEPGLRLFSLYLDNSQNFEAENTLKSLIQRFPENLQLHDANARLSIQNNNTAKAKNIYQQMARIAANKTALNNLLKISQSQKAINDFSGAKSTLDTALKLFPNNIFALAALAELNMNQGNTKTALQGAFNIIELSPTSAIGYQLAGDSSNLLGNTSNALKWYREGIKKSVGSERLALSYYRQLQENTTTKEAVTFLESWINKEKTYSYLSLQALATGYSKLGNFKRAININEELLKQQPDNAYILNNLALLYLETNNEKALPLAEKAYSLIPDSYAILDTLGWILTKQGDSQKGITFLRNAAARSFNSPEIQYHYAVALSLNGDENKAIQILQKTLSTHSDFSGINEAKLLLKRLHN